jgi:hypothetical protein
MSVLRKILKPWSLKAPASPEFPADQPNHYIGNPCFQPIDGQCLAEQFSNALHWVANTIAIRVPFFGAFMGWIEHLHETWGLPDVHQACWNRSQVSWAAAAVDSSVESFRVGGPAENTEGRMTDVATRDAFDQRCEVDEENEV